MAKGVAAKKKRIRNEISNTPRINLRCATENYPKRIRNTGSHAGHRKLRRFGIYRESRHVNIAR
jgi:hypothetical protein